MMLFYQAVSTLLPIFLLILIGWIGGKKDWIAKSSLTDMNNLVFYVAIPCLLFNSVATNDTVIKGLTNLFLTYYIAVSFIYIFSFAIGRHFFKLTVKESAVMAMASTFSNNLMVAFPILQFTWGEEATVRLFALLTIHATFLWGITLILIEIGNQNAQSRWHKSLKAIFLNLMKNPILVALTLASLWKLSHIPVPNFLANFTYFTGKMAAPLTLFILGVRLSSLSLNENKREPSFIVAMKCLVFPILVWSLGRYVFKLDDISVYVTTIMAAASVGVNPYILAQQYHIYERRVASAFLLSVLLCILTYTLWLAGFFAKIL